MKIKSLKTKILLNFFVIAFLASIACFISIINANRTNQLFYEILENDSPRINALVELKHLALNMHYPLSEYTKAATSSSHQNSINKIQDLKDKIKDNQEQYSIFAKKTSFSNSDQSISLKTNMLLEETDKFLNNSNSIVSPTLTQKLENSLVLFENSIKNEIAKENKLLIEKKARINSVASRLNTISISVAIASILLSIFLGYQISHGLMIHIKKLGETASQMAKGNLDIRLEKISDDELGELALHFNNMGERLKTYYETIQGEKARSDIIFESIGEGMLVVDPDGKILMMNHRAKMLIGWFEGIIGKRFVDLVPAKNESGSPIPDEMRPIMQALSTRQKVNTSTSGNIVHYIRKDGTDIPVEITSTPLFLKGRLAGAIELFHDIAKERQIDRMKTEFISLASHQLRTPLSAIKWFSDMLLAGDAGPINPEQKEFTTNISLSTERMIELVNSLLNISRIESGRIIVDPKPTNLKQLVEEVVSELRVKLNEREMKLVISVHGDLPSISIDPKLIRQVYMNLLTNAIKYTPKGGEITIIISKKENEVISQVSDNGYGIPLKDQEKVFQKFFRADNIIKVETDGSGLGLYLIKAIVESSNGRIWFKSEEEKGTTFWFSLPISGVQARKGEVSLDN